MWVEVSKWWGKDTNEVESLHNLLQDGTTLVNGESGTVLWDGTKWVILYLIWFHRNKMVFKNEKRKITECYQEIQRKSFEWIRS